MDDLRGTPMSVGTLEEIIDDNHAIVSTSVGSEHYVSILSFVDKDLLEPGCSVLLNHKVLFSRNPWAGVLRLVSLKSESRAKLTRARLLVCRFMLWLGCWWTTPTPWWQWWRWRRRHKRPTPTSADWTIRSRRSRFIPSDFSPTLHLKWLPMQGG